ncbi:MAG: M14 family zinc carboxypeptidase [Bacteroidales bacterium]|nr:M14 family zinc carboxypeptidase [Bacteroidales bacterium]
MKLLFVIILLFITTTYLSTQNLTYSKIKIYIKNKNDLAVISSKGFAIDGCYVTEKYIIGEFPTFLIDTLKKYSFEYKILIEDVSSFYKTRSKNAMDSLMDYKKKEKNVCFQDKYLTPQNFTLGTIGGYYSYNEILQKLNFIHTSYPNLTYLYVLTPSSIQNRPIYAIKISDNPNQNENEPKILYIGLTHAREPMSMQQIFFFALYLLENYNHPSVKYLIDNSEIYIIPCANPDGYVKNNIENPEGGGMHRKNCRNVGTYNKGVDLNRNYGYMWGFDNIGSSNYPDAETYRGTAPFSEPETQAIKNFIEQIKFDFIIDHHCYSNVLLNPWSYINLNTPDSLLYKFYSELLTTENGFLYGTPYEAIGYNANGCSFDWFYGEQITKPKIIGWGSESGYVNDGFYPSPNRIEHIAKSFMDMNLMLLRFATKYALILNRTNRYISYDSFIKFDVLNIGKISPATFTVSVHFENNLVSVSDNYKTYQNLGFTQIIADSFNIFTTSDIEPGTLLKYYFKIETDLGFYYTDTFEVIYGTPQVIFYDACNNTQNWTCLHWGITNNDYISAPYCFTDSPNGYYSDNITATLTLNNNIYIPDSAYTELSFCAKWDIEALSDYVQIQISENNGYTWQTLCGKYSTPSFLSANYGSPIYEGIRKKWINEYINLSEYKNKNVKIRFVLKSNNGLLENDGIYIDDIKIISITNENLHINDAITEKFIYPTPTSSTVYLPQLYEKIIVFDLLFNKVCEFNKTNVIDIGILPAGLYFITVINNNESKIHKIIKL